MQRFIVIRILHGLLAIFVISLIVFALSRVAGDPIAAILDDETGQEQIELLRKEWGLDKPLHVQYFTYMRRLLTGDLGTSFKWDRPVAELIAEKTAGHHAAIRVRVVDNRRHCVSSRGFIGGEEGFDI